MNTTLYSPAAARRAWLDTNALYIEQGRQILQMGMIVNGGQAFRFPTKLLPTGCEQILYDEMRIAGWTNRISENEVTFYPNTEGAPVLEKAMHDAVLPFADTLRTSIHSVIQGLVASGSALQTTDQKGATQLVNLAEQLGRVLRAAEQKAEHQPE